MKKKLAQLLNFIHKWLILFVTTYGRINSPWEYQVIKIIKASVIQRLFFCQKNFGLVWSGRYPFRLILTLIVTPTKPKQKMLTYEQKAEIKKLLGKTMPYFPWENTYDQFDQGDEDSSTVDAEDNSDVDEDAKYIKETQEENFT